MMLQSIQIWPEFRKSIHQFCRHHHLEDGIWIPTVKLGEDKAHWLLTKAKMLLRAKTLLREKDLATS
jgi:hypothetical protein